jgi:hypothetical protein
MADIAALKKLAPANISKDSAKTQERIKELWDPSSKEQKDALKKIANITQAQTIRNIVNSGHISARMALLLAQTFNVSPFYISAETDEAGEYGDALESAFLEQYKPKKAAEKTGKAKKSAAPKQERKKKETKAKPLADAEPGANAAALSAAPEEISPAPKKAAAPKTAKAAKAPKAQKTPKAPKAPKPVEISKPAKPDKVVEAAIKAFKPVGNQKVLSIDLDQEELSLLFDSLVLRADLGQSNAQEKLDKILDIMLA